MGDLLLTLFVRMLFWILRFLPHAVVVRSFEMVLRFALMFLPRYQAVMETNILLAFPDRDESWREQLRRDSLRSIARFLADAVRIAALDTDWVERHVIFDRKKEFFELHECSPTGVLIATGHLGSFELLARVASLSGFPISFVVRNLRLRTLDRWWRSIRELDGNRVISRRGAYREVVAELKRGRDVAMLFDQNVTRNRAVFVDFFGHPAATTRALALAIQQTSAPLIVAGLVYRGDDQYEILWRRCEIEGILEDELSRSEKTFRITEVMSKMYEELIRESPAEWFWLHRRWKTQPSENDPSVYPAVS